MLKANHNHLIRRNRKHLVLKANGFFVPSPASWKRHLLIFPFCLALLACHTKKETPPPAAPRVTTQAIVEKETPIYVNAIGQVISPVTVNVRPQVNGKLINTYIEQGAMVEEGQVIYEIDPRPYVALLEQAKAQQVHDEALLKYAEQAVERYKKVVEQDFVSILTFEQYQSTALAAKAQVDLDKAAVQAAEINVEFCKIVAPVSGKISFFNVDVGNILVIDDPNQLTTIRPFSPIDITFALPQQQFESIRKEQGNAGEWPFIAILPELPDSPISGTTYFIDNQLNQNTGTILLKGRLPNDSRILWPGQFVRLKVLHKTVKDALIVPPSAVLMGKDGPYIYLVDQGSKAVVAQVEVLTREDAYIALHSATAKAGDSVVVDGQINIAPGLPVQPVQAVQTNQLGAVKSQ